MIFCIFNFIYFKIRYDFPFDFFLICGLLRSVSFLIFGDYLEMLSVIYEVYLNLIQLWPKMNEHNSGLKKVIGDWSLSCRVKVARKLKGRRALYTRQRAWILPREQ